MIHNKPQYSNPFSGYFLTISVALRVPFEDTHRIVEALKSNDDKIQSPGMLSTTKSSKSKSFDHNCTVSHSVAPRVPCFLRHFAMPFILFPLFPATDLSVLPEGLQSEIRHSEVRWIRCALSNSATRNNEFHFLTVDGRCDLTDATLWNNDHSVVAPLQRVPAVLHGMADACDPTNATTLRAVCQSAGQETLEVVECCLRCIDILLDAMPGPRTEHRQRRRRLTQLRSDLRSVKQACASQSSMWNALSLSLQEFLSQSEMVSHEDWEQAAIFFTSSQQFFRKRSGPWTIGSRGELGRDLGSVAACAAEMYGRFRQEAPAQCHPHRLFD